MNGTFRLTIELGNAGMSDLADLADALNDVVDLLTASHPEGIVRDINGNTVGRFALEEES